MSLRRIVSRTKVTISGSDVDAYYTSYTTPRVKHIESGTYYDCTLETATGRYVVDTPDGHLVFFDGTTEKPLVLGSEGDGGTWFGDETLPYLPRDVSGGTWDSHFDAQAKTIENIRDIDGSSEPGHALNVGSGDVRYVLLDASGSDQTIEDGIIFNTTPKSATDAVDDEDIPNFAQVRGLVVANQQSTRTRRILANGDTVAGQVYPDCNTALSAISDNAVSKQYQLQLEEGGASPDGTPDTDNVFYCSHANLKNYVHFYGFGTFTRLVLGTTGTSVSKTITFENMSVYMGLNDINADRIYNSITFRNCHIYAWKNITFSSCKLENVVLYQPSGKGFTIAGASTIQGLDSMQSMTSDTGTGIRRGIADGLNTSYTMPDDISLAP